MMYEGILMFSFTFLDVLYLLGYFVKVLVLDSQLNCY